MLCGTALYIYHGISSTLQEQTRTQAALEQQRNELISNQTAELSDADVFGGSAPRTPAVRRLPDFKSLVPDIPPGRTNIIPTFSLPKPDELQRANDIAEQAERQRRWDSINAQFQAINQQATLDEIEYDLEFRRLQPALPQRNDWTLQYNYFNNTWRYAPMDSSLRYNPFGNDWEFVPPP